jgi:hypothetical protein
MAVSIDPSAAQLMRVSSELLAAQDTIRQQRKTIWGLVLVLRAERQASAALADVLDVLLDDDG